MQNEKISTISPMNQNANGINIMDKWHSVQGFALPNNVGSQVSSVNPWSASQIFQILLKALVIGTLPFIVFIAVTSRTSIIGGIRSFVVLTGSMEPAAPVGSIVFTKSFPVYQPNDIIAFKSGNVTVTHRVIDFEIKNKEYFYKTQGDANNNPDSQQVSASKVIGKAFYIVPFVGKVSIFIKTLPGFLSLIVFPALIFIIFELLNIKKELTKEIEKRMMQKMQTI